MGPTRTHQLLAIRLGDTPHSWQTAGFRVEPGGAAGSGSVALGRTSLSLDSSGGGVVGWSLEGVDGDIDGLCSIPDESGDPSSVQATHPNGIVGIDHVVVSTGDVERTVEAFARAGLVARGGRSTTSYGAPMRQVFLWAGDVILELVGPDVGEPVTDAPATVFGLALVAADLDTTAATLGELLGTPKDAVQAGRRIAGLRHRDAGISLPVAVMSPHVRP